MGELAVLDREYWAKKSNALNEMRAQQFTLQELRLLAVYLSRIDRKDKSTRVVRFPMSEFTRILEVGKVNVSALKAHAKRLLGHVAEVPLENGYVLFQFFKKCRVEKDDKDGVWYVHLDAHDDALPLFFELKPYFMYKVKNALALKSVQQIRMYEVLKQYERGGKREISIEKLKEMLFLEKGAYPEYKIFAREVLKRYQTALKQYTDICYEYEGYKVNSRKINWVRFTIFKNPDYVDQLMLDEYIEAAGGTSEYPAKLKQLVENIEVLASVDGEHETVALLRSACDDEFTADEMNVLALRVGGDMGSRELFDHIRLRYLTMKNNKKVKHRFKYLCSLMGKPV